jgi:hypothetical protein
MRIRSLLMLLACLAVAGCADNGKRPDDDRFGGFYGGVTGGAVP